MGTLSLLVVTFAQTAQTVAPAAAPPRNTEFDFWVGKWNCEGQQRTQPGKDEWTNTKCSNTIKFNYNKQLLEENFSTKGFAGRSWTMYHAPSKTWRQTWVDDTGAYLSFEGKWDAGKMTLTQNFPVAGKFRQQMVFSNITTKSFDWHWQLSTDEGKTWETQWELRYTKAKA